MTPAGDRAGTGAVLGRLAAGFRGVRGRRQAAGVGRPEEGIAIRRQAWQDERFFMQPLATGRKWAAS